MKRSIAILLAMLLAVLIAVPALSAAAVDTDDAPVELIEGTYVPHQVVVLFRDSAIDADTVPKKGNLAAVGADFGGMMDASSSEDAAYGAADEEIDILTASLGNGFVLEDTLVFGDDAKAAVGGLASVGASGEPTTSGDLTVALVSSDKYDTATLIEKLSKNKRVTAVEPNYILQPQSYDYSLNDPLNWYNYQANSPLAKNTGGDAVSDRGYAQESYLSTNAGYAWSELTGDEDEIVVAIIDSGITEDHEDLREMLWTNPGDIGLLGEHGFNFYDNQSDVTDVLGHGTHCSGIIAAQANNHIGLSGVGSMANLKIMMCSTNTAFEEVDEDQHTYSYRELGAFNYVLKAKQRGVNIVATSNSWGSPGRSEIYDAVIDRLGEEGVISFFAAGNDHLDLDDKSYKPAGGNSPYMVTVGAAKIDGNKAGFSNYGRSKVDLFAPGVDILSTVGYATYFPNIYSEEKRSATTGVYGLFDANTVISDGSATPSLTGCDDTVGAFGASVFRVQDFQGQEVAESQATCELSVDTKYTFTKSDHPASLKVTIRGAAQGEQYYLYFPYQKDPATTGSDNTDFSIYLTHSFEDGDMPASMMGGEVVVGKGGSCSLTGNGCSGSSNDKEHNGISTHINGRSAITDVISSADELAGRQVGIGICVTPTWSWDEHANTITLYLDSIAVSKPGAEIMKEDSYEIMSGTSMACPAAAGAYAVLASLYPRAEGQSGSEYALQNRARLLSSVRKTDALNDFCVSGGYLDLSLIDDNNPVLTRVECDMENSALILSGANLSPDCTLQYRRMAQEGSEPVALPSDGMTAEFSEDGNSIVIHNAKALFSTYTQFTLSESDIVVAKICDFLVKGQKKLEKICEETFPPTIDDHYYIVPKRYMLTDTKGEALYGYEPGTGVVSKYDGVQFNDFKGTDLNESVLGYYREKGYDIYEIRHDFRVDLGMLNAPIYTDNKLFHFIEVRHIPSEDAEYQDIEYLLASIDYTAEKPSWSFEQTTSFEFLFHMEECANKSFCGLDGKIYCLGEGLRKGAEDSEPFMFSYDVAKRVWTEEEGMPLSLSSPMLCAKDGKLYAAFGFVYTESEQQISNTVYCYDGAQWEKLPDIPYIGDRLSSQAGMTSVLIKGTCAAVKDGLLFFNCPTDGGGNVFLYRTDTGACEPLYYTFTDYKADNLILYSAVETRDGVYYFEESNDGYLDAFDLYLLPADSGAYTPDYQAALLGDVDSDGDVTIFDATYIQRELAGLEIPVAFNDAVADADRDDSVTIFDVTCLQRWLAGLSSNDDIGKPIA